MDRKSIILLVVCFVLLMLWYPLVVNKLYPPKTLPHGATNAPMATFTATNHAATSAAPAVVEEPVPAPTAVVGASLPEELLEVTNNRAHYTFTSHGGGLKLVELLDYPENVAARRAKGSQTTNVATLNSFSPAPTLAVLGGEAVQGDGVFQLARTATGVRAEKTLTNGLTIVKDFQLSTNYLVFATVRLENRTAQPLVLPGQNWVVGMATPMNNQDDGSAEGLMWSTGAKAQDIVGASFFSSRGFACTQRVPPSEYRGGLTNVAWAAVHNQFFALGLAPNDPATQVVMWKVDLPRPSEAEISADTRTARQPAGYEAALVYPGLTVAPHTNSQRHFIIYAGPKEYRTLANISSTFGNDLDAIMGYGGFFGFFSKGLLLWMNWLHATVSLPYGWAIIAITVVLKAVFWPLTAASTRSAKRMQALQPQIKALQEKYKDDPAKAQRKMMEFWKEHKINPMSGCLPMLIQMPVFLAFYWVLLESVEMRQAPFMGWIGDLSARDPFFILPAMMAAANFINFKLNPQMGDPVQQRMFMIMQIAMPVMFAFMPSGLVLYWTTNTVLSILQQWNINRRLAAARKARN